LSPLDILKKVLFFLKFVGNNEVKVVLRIKDVNDNSPRFKQQGRPIVAAIPTSASYGYQIATLKATDDDEGKFYQTN